MNDSLPLSLVGYRQALEEAIRRDLDAGRTRRRRGIAVRAVLAGAVLTAVALGALSLVSRPASGASVVHRAAAAIARSPGTILHVDLIGSQTNPDVTWRDESWQQESPPYARRQVETQPDGSVGESASTKDSAQIYDPKTNTIYISHSSPEGASPTPVVVPGPSKGSFLLRMKPNPGNVKPVVLTARQAKALRKGTMIVGIRISKKKNGAAAMSLGVMPAPPNYRPHAKSKESTDDPDPTSGEFRNQILALLNSGGAHVAGHRTIDGRDAIEIDSANGHTTYYVDPESFAPVELVTRGTDAENRLRFRIYEKLELAGNGDLLSLRAQHPTARVDRDRADYDAALKRLFPKG